MMCSLYVPVMCSLRGGGGGGGFWERRVLTEGAYERKRATDEVTIGACDVFITGGAWECTN